MLRDAGQRDPLCLRRRPGRAPVDDDRKASIAMIASGDAPVVEDTRRPGVLRRSTLAPISDLARRGAVLRRMLDRRRRQLATHRLGAVETGERGHLQATAMRNDVLESEQTDAV